MRIIDPFDCDERPTVLACSSHSEIFHCLGGGELARGGRLEADHQQAGRGDHQHHHGKRHSVHATLLSPGSLGSSRAGSRPGQDSGFDEDLVRCVW